jgi:hypothetical protein
MAAAKSGNCRHNIRSRDLLEISSIYSYEREAIQYGNGPHLLWFELKRYRDGGYRNGVPTANDGFTTY